MRQTGCYCKHKRNRKEAPPQTRFVPAKCTCCGANLQVDISDKSAVCPYCNTTFVVEQAINQYNISLNGNVNIASANITTGPTVESLILRAQNFEKEADFDSAIEYYNRVLDIEPENTAANTGLKRAQERKDNYIYFISPSGEGRLVLYHNYLITYKKPHSLMPVAYHLRTICSVSHDAENLIFHTEGIIFSDKHVFPCPNPAEWESVLKSALLGMYPPNEVSREFNRVTDEEIAGIPTATPTVSPKDKVTDEGIAEATTATPTVSPENFVYFASDAWKGFTKGGLLLKKDKLIFIAFSNGKETVYPLDDIYDIMKGWGDCFIFRMRGKVFTTTFTNCKEAANWITILNEAKEGRYPTE